METNLSSMEANLNGADYIKHKDDIQSNRNLLNSLKNKTSSEWREYATPVSYTHLPLPTTHYV